MLHQQANQCNSVLSVLYVGFFTKFWLLRISVDKDKFTNFYNPDGSDASVFRTTKLFNLGLYIFMKNSVINNVWDIEIEQFHLFFLLSFSSIH